MRLAPPKPGIYHGVPMEEYLAWDAWSKSDLAEAAKSPEEAHYAYHTRDWKPSTPSQVFGTLAHTCLLEPHRWPPGDVAWIPGPYNSNPGRALKKDAEERGFRVEKPETREAVEALCARARRHPWIADLLAGSEYEREVSAVARDPHTGLCLKARADLWMPGIATIGDLKTTTLRSDPATFAPLLWAMDYALGAAHYLHVFSEATGMDVDVYLWVVAPQRPPHVPRVYVADDMTLEKADAFATHLRQIVSRCLATGEWPGPAERIETIGFRAWHAEQIDALVGKEYDA